MGFLSLGADKSCDGKNDTYETKWAISWQMWSSMKGVPGRGGLMKDKIFEEGFMETVI